MEEKLVLLCTRLNRQERNIGKDMKVPASKPIHRNKYQYISELCKKLQNHRNFEKVYSFALSFQTRNAKFLLFYDCSASENIFRLFHNNVTKTKAFNLKVSCKELRLANLRQKDSLHNKS